MNVVANFTWLAQILREFEGCYLNAYADTGEIWTIGFGSTYNFNQKRKVLKGDVITLEDAVKFFRIDQVHILDDLNRYIKKPLNPYQSTAICDYVYNRGIRNFLRTQLDELINENPSDPQILAVIKGTGLMDSLGNRLRGLQRRRNCEAHLYNTGEIKFIFK